MVMCKWINQNPQELNTIHNLDAVFQEGMMMIPYLPTWHKSKQWNQNSTSWEFEAEYPPVRANDSNLIGWKIPTWMRVDVFSYGTWGVSNVILVFKGCNGVTDRAWFQMEVVSFSTWMKSQTSTSNDWLLGWCTNNTAPIPNKKDN